MNESASALNGKIVNRTAKVGIVGLGYVGLPLAVEFANAGFEVTGFDVLAAKAERINAGDSYVQDIPSSVLKPLVDDGRLRATTDFSAIHNMDTINICVPTPLNKNREPDISYILETGKAIAPHLGSKAESRQKSVVSSPVVPREPSSVLRPPSSVVSPAPSPISHLPSPTPKLVVLESTTYPGTTDEDLRAVLETGSGLKAGVDFHLAFSPEREDPGNPQSVVATIPKIVGGVEADRTSQVLVRGGLGAVRGLNARSRSSKVSTSIIFTPVVRTA